MNEQTEFENEVIRIAQHRWPESGGAGGPTMLDGRERDGIFETDEVIHLVEATVSRSEKKAEDDIKKLRTAAEKLQKRYPQKAVKGWFVTR